MYGIVCQYVVHASSLNDFKNEQMHIGLTKKWYVIIE